MANSNDDKYFMQNDGLIKMAALGRRFHIGTLYDYRTDSIIEGKAIFFNKSCISHQPLNIIGTC